MLQDLCNYKYDQMIVKSLDILNKLYSSQMDMFQLAGHAQVYIVILLAIKPKTDFSLLWIIRYLDFVKTTGPCTPI